MRKQHSFRATAKALLDGGIHAARTLAARHPGALPAYDRLLRRVQARTGLLRPSGRPGDTRNPLNAGLLSLSLHHADWLRPPEGWDPPPAARSFAALARHLLARYPVPPFMTSVWFDLPPGDALPQHGWYKHLGRGGSVRTAGLPVRLTRAMAHEFAHAPHHYTAAQAARWAQVRGLGGSEPLARVVAATRLGRGWGDEDFWETALRFFVRHPALDLANVGPVVDFLQHVKFEWRDGVSAAGVFGPQPPPRPDYSLAGRTASSVLRQVDEWHRGLGRDAGLPCVWWRHSAVRDFRLVEGAEAAGDMRAWTVTELLSSRELVAEGRAMRHCVAAYIRGCARRQTSIWSVRVETRRGRSRVLTVEVDLTTGAVVQVRGRCNRLPRPAELEVVGRWAAGEGLTVAEAVRR